MNTRQNQAKPQGMPPAIYEKYEQARTEFEKEVKDPVSRDLLRFAAWKYGNKLKSIKH